MSDYRDARGTCLGLLVALLCLAACGESPVWPEFEEARGRYADPWGELTPDNMVAIWKALLTQDHERQALGDAPLLSAAVAAAEAGASTTKEDCPGGGKVTADYRRPDYDHGIPAQVRLRYRDCRYDLPVGAVLLPQMLDGDLYLEKGAAGGTLTHGEVSLFVEGHERETTLEFLEDAKSVRYLAPGRYGHVVAEVPLTGPGLAGVIPIAATNGDWECQDNQGTLFCTRVGGEDILEAELNPPHGEGEE
jgi:hypothetical protein